jgi:hypothetical protein
MKFRWFMVVVVALMAILSPQAHADDNDINYSEAAYVNPFPVVDGAESAAATPDNGYDTSLGDLSGVANTYLESPSGDYLSYPGYITTWDDLFIKPLGDNGPVTPLDLPTDSYSYGQTVPEGAKIVEQTVLADFNNNLLSPDHPDVVVGYSDSSVMDSEAMTLLHQDGVPLQDVVFVFTGNTSQPETGYIADFVSNPENAWAINLVGMQDLIGQVTPTDLYKVDSVMLNGDGYADYSANAWDGQWIHLLYGGVAESQLQSATEVTTGALETFTISDFDLGTLIDGTLQNIFGW